MYDTGVFEVDVVPVLAVGAGTITCPPVSCSFNFLQQHTQNTTTAITTTITITAVTVPSEAVPELP